jgi:PEP-CTERM motif-containing protein
VKENSLAIAGATIWRLRFQKELLPIFVVGLIMAFVTAKPADALTITATFGSGAATVSPAAQAVINSTIQFYENTFNDPINVFIQFNNMSTGLGSSNFWFYSVGYSAYHTALLTDAKSTEDTAALATLPSGNNNPVTNNTTMQVKGATGRAVGLNTPAASGLSCSAAALDGCIGLNLAITDVTVAGGFSLFAVTEHEIDEILGLGSALHGTTTPSTPWAEDLFRYASPGVRSFSATGSTTNPCGASTSSAFLSIDGTNLIDQFNNCNNGGDYGDWITHTPTQVQDAFTNNSAKPFLTLSSPEIMALDVIGYDLAPQAVPEPASALLIGIGFACIAVVRRRTVSKNK